MDGPSIYSLASSSNSISCSQPKMEFASLNRLCSSLSFLTGRESGFTARKLIHSYHTGGRNYGARRRGSSWRGKELNSRREHFGALLEDWTFHSNSVCRSGRYAGGKKLHFSCSFWQPSRYCLCAMRGSPM